MSSSSSPLAPLPQPIITPRLILRIPHSSDAADVSAIFVHPPNTAFEPRKPVNPTPEKYRPMIEDWRKDAREGKSAFMVVCLREPESESNHAADNIDEEEQGDGVKSGLVIGFGGINSIFTKASPPSSSDASSAPLKVADIGIVIHTPYLRNGYAREALSATLSAALDGKQFGAESVILETMEGNKPFRALMKALGLGRLEEVDGEKGECRFEVRRRDWEDIVGKGEKVQ